MSGIPMMGKQSQVTWEGDLTPPITSYASSLRSSPMHSGLRTRPTTNQTRSAVVNRRDLRKGLLYYYSHGGLDMPATTVPTNGAGGVNIGRYQRTLVQLHDWVINLGWRMGGYPRNLGYSFRVDQLKTQVTGGSGPGAMVTKPVFPAVQVVPRYAATIRRYPTKASAS